MPGRAGNRPTAVTLPSVSPVIFHDRRLLGESETALYQRSLIIGISLDFALS